MISPVNVRAKYGDLKKKKRKVSFFHVFLLDQYKFPQMNLTKPKVSLMLSSQMNPGCNKLAIRTNPQSWLYPSPSQQSSKKPLSTRPLKNCLKDCGRIRGLSQHSHSRPFSYLTPNVWAASHSLQCQTFHTTKVLYCVCHSFVSLRFFNPLRIQIEQRRGEERILPHSSWVRSSIFLLLPSG